MSITESYTLGDELGRGAFSIVKKGIEKKTGKAYAIKIIDKTKACGEAEKKRLATEVKILQQVKHPNIVGLKDLFETKTELYLVMELITGGELFDKIVEKGQYTEKDASIIVAKILNAVDYLHNQGIAHRDLKPENLLLRGGDDTEVLISDFGLSKIVDQSAMMETACGTPYYVAPEVLQATGYDKEVDLWSVGVITYLLLCGFPPFYGENLPEVFEQIMKAAYDFPSPYWDNVSANAKDFIKKLLVVDPKKRLNAQQAMQHPWIAQGGAKTILNTQAKLKDYNMQRHSKANVKKD
jgi:calcium/calmodulin-dependent protein kinase I